MIENNIDDWIKKLKPEPIVVGKGLNVDTDSVSDGYVVGNTPFLKGVMFSREEFSFVDGAFEYCKDISNSRAIKVEFSFKTKKPYKLFDFESISNNNVCRLKEYSKNEYIVEITFLTKDEEDFIRNVKIIMVNSYNARKHIPLRFKFNIK